MGRKDVCDGIRLNISGLIRAIKKMINNKKAAAAIKRTHCRGTWLDPLTLFVIIRYDQSSLRASG